MEMLMSAESELRVTEDVVAIVEICRPPNNYLDLGLMVKLADCLDGLAAGGEVRSVVLCSEGKHFCAGVDLGSQPKVEHAGLHFYDVALRLFEQPLPIVAAVQGRVVGGGLGLALAADFRVAVPGSQFVANFARLGFHHGFGLSVTLPRVVGQQVALEMLLTGRAVAGTEARATGLVDRLAADGELRLCAADLAGEIAKSAPLAVRSIRQTLRAPLLEEVRQVLEREKSEQHRLTHTEDFKEGMSAVSQRREPEFSGR